MNSKHRRTLDAIFAEPTRADIRWEDVEALFKGCGGVVSQGQGSRVRVALGGMVVVFHRPHPQPTADKATVKRARALLAQGVSGHE